MLERFRDRFHAGSELARQLQDHAGRKDVVVLGLARGGVPVAYQVAEELKLPLDVFIVRKLGVPGREELAMGAIASGGIRVINEDIVGSLAVPEEDVARVAAQEQEVLEKRQRTYRGGRAMPDLRGKRVIVVDDGVATGASMKAAVQALRQQEPERVVVAVPVGAPSTCQELEELADELVCVRTPTNLGGIGAWYQDFSQTPDEEVQELLKRAVQPAEA